MQAKSVLLEPYYDFRILLPSENVGRAMSDIQKMNGKFEPPEPQGDETLLCGVAPVSALRGYAQELTAYTKGRGRIALTLHGYDVCYDALDVIARAGYDPERDLENPPDSVFCAHGAGFVVKWNQVKRYMHVDTGLRIEDGKLVAAPQKSAEPRAAAPVRYTGSLREDRELEAIFQRTYGPIKSGHYFDVKPVERERAQEKFRLLDLGQEYLLVDGYNILFAWPELKKLSQTNVEAARHTLMDILSNYQGYKKCVVILVFDAYKVERTVHEVERYHNIYVVYTKEAETADMYIEKATYEIGRHKRVRVATSDNMEQLIILGHGAQRVSARAFQEEVRQTSDEIRAIIERINRQD